jgi:phosphoadenosine phosphosulfate reductase
MSAIDLYARHTPGFEDRVAHTVAMLQGAAAAYAGSIVQSTSLGVEDMVVTDLIARHGIAISVATLDTGMLHAETLALIPRIEQRYDIAVEVFKPVAESVVHFVASNGSDAMYRSLALRKACCGLRKMEPLARMLAGRSAWVTGLRREQSNHRAAVPFSEVDDQGRSKFNVLAEWSWNDVWHYIASNDVPYNPLHDEFMPSIGCAPCTRAIGVGEDFRAGRWWWENEDAKECGLHVKPHAANAQAVVGSPSEPSGGIVSATAHFGAAEVKVAPATGQSHNEDAKECGLHAKPHAANAQGKTA